MANERKLLHKDGREVQIGDEVTSFRGEKYIVEGWPQNGRNRVWVANPHGSDEFFPSVFDLKWANDPTMPMGPNGNSRID